MKRRTRTLLAAVERLVGEDLTELRDAVIAVDERTSAANLANSVTFRSHDRRIADLEAILADNANHSRRIGDCVSDVVDGER